MDITAIVGLTGAAVVQIMKVVDQYRKLNPKATDADIQKYWDETVAAFSAMAANWRSK